MTICNSPELSLLDNQLDELYTQSLKALGETKRKELVLAQRQWVRGVIGCATDADCLDRQYQEQLQKLKSVLKTAAAAAAAPQVKPSFDCAKPRSPAEVAVCNNPELAALDQELGRLYTQKQKEPGFFFFGRQRLLHSQRHWLRNRDTCAGDVACLKVQYQAAIEHLQ